MNITTLIKKSAGRAALSAVLATTVLGITIVGADAASAKSDPKHERHGEAAIAALGDHVDDIAGKMHISPGQLQKMLRTDGTLKVDDAGKLLASDPAQSGQSTITDKVTSPVYATSQTFALHSRPNSPMKIYLDFTGHTTSNTDWNRNYTAGRPFTTYAFDRDGSPSTFSSYEHAIIQATWLSVREDFAPFNIDVTTQDPGYEGLRYSGAGDVNYGTRVVIGPKTNNWYPYNAGGVGYFNSFGNNDTPVYVFTTTSSSSKFIGEASSHETGHSFGLAHDGTPAAGDSDYYAGHGNWAPIMGNSYSKAVTQWSSGEYAGADNKQDDLGMIASYTGWSTDDYAATTSTTGTLPTGVTRYGIINWTGDVDAYRFSIGSARKVQIQTWPNTGPVDSDLNMRVVVRNSAGAVVVTSSPTGDLQQNFTWSLPAGVYTVSVDGVGEGSAYNTGYSAYGSLGYYGIQLNLV